MTGNIIQIFGSFSLLFSGSNANYSLEILKYDTIFVGFGCFFAWIQLLYYLEFNDNIIVLSTILKKSFFSIVSYYAFYVPLFIGFVVLGKFKTIPFQGLTLN